MVDIMPIHPFGNHDPYSYSFTGMQFRNCMKVYTFPSKMKLSVGIVSWLQSLVMKMVMSTKTRNISFDGKPNSDTIRCDISQK